jgi:antitoxin HicB
MIFPAKLIPHPQGGYTVVFPGLPGITGTVTEEATLAHEVMDALIQALEPYFDDLKPIPPQPQPESGDYVLALSGARTLKVQLVTIMALSGVGVEELARRMNLMPETVKNTVLAIHCDRGEFHHFEKAFDALGCRLQWSLIVPEKISQGVQGLVGG